MKYYNLHEINAEEAAHPALAVYADAKNEHFFYLNCGDLISMKEPNGDAILHNTEIEGVVEAENDADAADIFGLHPVESPKGE